MSSERWQRLDEVFVEALQQPAEERAACVARICGSDSALEAEALSLLAAAEQSREFMIQPALEWVAQTFATGEGRTLQPGDHLGAYTVVQLLGSGGAGEVWRATDKRLEREVAIKVLRPYLVTDPRRLRRFAEEARMAGALNHANILAVYDVGEHHGIPFLVSELLQGQTLRQRLGAGTVPVDEAHRIASAIANGLAAAHARGIVHRDLKPENIFLRSDRGVKILDFGLAKLRQPSSEGAGRSQAEALERAVAGTAGYMAPEQIRGEDVDTRADLFAVGAITYEMLAGRRAFKGTNALETLRATLVIEPADLTKLNRDMLPLSRIVMRLLNKDVRLRFQSAIDLVWALEQVGAGTDEVNRSTHVPGKGHSRRFRYVAGLTAATLVAVSGALWLRGARASRELPPTSDVTRFSWTLPEGVGLASTPVVSPDSRYIAFTGTDASGTHLYVKALGSFEAVPVTGSDDARQPFWSPDSQWVGYFAQQRVMKVSVADPTPRTIVEPLQGPEAAVPRSIERGGAWGRSGFIVYGGRFGIPNLSRVAASGGPSVPGTVLARSHGDNTHRFPAFLPDGLHYLYFIRAETESRRGVYIGRVDAEAEPRSRLLASESEAVYAPLRDGHGMLLWVANGRVQAQKFDPVSRSLVGHVLSLPVEAGGSTLFNSAMLSASSDVLAYSPSPLPFGNSINSVDENGQHRSVVSAHEAQLWPRVSPDGGRLARLRIDPLTGDADIWVQDLRRRTQTRITHSLERDMMHVWSPDGSRLAYRPDVPDQRRLSMVAADGSGASSDLMCPKAHCEPTDWSSDGRFLVVNAYGETSTDVWEVATDSQEESRPLLTGRFNERDGRLSPNGQWLAYVSDESGTPEVSIRSIAGPPRRYTISTGGGDQPVWHRNGSALFFVDAGGRLRRVAVRETANGLTLGSPTANALPSIGSGHAATQYDLAPDGRVYYLDPAEGPRPTEIRVILGWQALILGSR